MTRVLQRLAVGLFSFVAIGVAGEPESSRHMLFTQLLEKYVDKGLVDYEGFAADGSFPEYLRVLSSTSPESLATREDKLALWLNAYNAYTIKLIIDRSPLESIRDIGLGLPVLFGPWSISFANVGGKEYSLNEIEHDIIRETFKDARVHFALVCASRSCPHLRKEAYEGTELGRQLEDDARRFINNPSLNRFDRGERTVSLSKIFDWYASDFEEEAGSVRIFLSKYIESGESRELLWLENAEILYLPYDWSLNGK